MTLNWQMRDLPLLVREAVEARVRCEGNHEYFRMYEHRGLRYSIFEGDSQIAAFTKNRVTTGKGNQYDIQMNADANLLCH